VRRAERINQPQVIQRARQCCAYFVRERHRFPELRAQLRLFGRKYERRSERLEAIGLVAAALLYWFDILSMRVGKPSRKHPRRVDGLSMHTISEWTGLSERRIDRAISDLHRAGYLASRTIDPGKRKAKAGYILASPQPVEEYGNFRRRLFRGLAAVRCFTERFFDRLGILPFFRRERQKRIDERKQLAAVVDLGAHRQHVESSSVKTLTLRLAAKLSTEPGDSSGGSSPRPPPDSSS
jgi:hypothetical protein